MTSAEVCGAAPQQHHVPAVSASTSVLFRDIGSPGVWLPQGMLATQSCSYKLASQNVLMSLPY